MAGYAVHAYHVRRPGKAGATRQWSLSWYALDNSAGCALDESGQTRNVISGVEHMLLTIWSIDNADNELHFSYRNDLKYFFRISPHNVFLIKFFYFFAL